MFSFAGLWEEWINPENNESVISFTIITCEPNELLKDIHNRMPVILSEDKEESWINPDLSHDAAKGFLKPYSAELMYSYAVSTLVNSPKNENQQIIAPIQKQQSLT